MVGDNWETSGRRKHAHQSIQSIQKVLRDKPEIMRADNPERSGRQEQNHAGKESRVESVLGDKWRQVGESRAQ